MQSFIGGSIRLGQRQGFSRWNSAHFKSSTRAYLPSQSNSNVVHGTNNSVKSSQNHLMQILGTRFGSRTKELMFPGSSGGCSVPVLSPLAAMMSSSSSRCMSTDALPTTDSSESLTDVPTRIKFKRLDKTARHIMQILDKEAVEEVKEQREVPDIKPGYIVQLKVEVPENKRRLSTIKGIVIARRNAGLNTTFRIRRMVAGVGVESLFPLYSPNIKEMATLSMDIATTFINFTTRCGGGRRPPTLPLFFKPSTIHTRSISSKSLSSFPRTVLSTTKANRCRRFSVSATATTTPQSEDSDVSTKIPPDNRIPATIITGFLGSGKTTLLNHILTADHGKRIAVIENEFGEVDIDGSLVAAKSAGAEDIVMLNNGCLCCTVRGDLVRMIAELVNKKKGRFDHIVIETTGLANPAPIIQTFYAEDQVFNDVKLDGVVTLVDAKHVGFHLDEVKPKGVVNEAVEQIAYADRIIVNKTDLVGEPEIASLVKRIRNINGMAHLKRTEFGKVDLEYVLGIGGFDLERIESSVNDEGAKEDHAHHHDHDHDHDHDHHHHHHHEHDHKHDHHHHESDHTHDPGVSSVSIVCEGSLDLEKANMWLGTLLLDRSEDIYRMKGLLSVEGMDERFVFQGVHDIFQGSPDRLWGADEPRVNKLVFIGKNLNAEELEKGFKACLL